MVMEGFEMKEVAGEPRKLLSKFFDTCFFTGKIAQVEEFRTANTSAADYFDLVDAVAVDRENTLDTYTVGTDFTYGNGFTRTLAAHRDTYPFVTLNTSFLAFFDRYGQTYRITGTEFRDIFLSDLGIFEIFDVLISHKMSFFDAVKAAQA